MIIEVVISKQRLLLKDKCRVLSSYSISTSKYGAGNRSGSNKTPLGLHQIVSKIGRNAPLHAIFKCRRNTGKIGKIRDRGDFITTRILRLSGLEKGINKGRGIDSFRRYIYIHGTPEEWMEHRRG